MHSTVESRARVVGEKTQHDKASNTTDTEKSRELLQAAAAADLRKVQFLIDSGADINYQADTGSKFTPLHWAVFERHYEVAIYLLKEGANPNIADATGMRPIDFMSATDSSAGSDVLLQLLKEKGAR